MPYSRRPQRRSYGARKTYTRRRPAGTNWMNVAKKALHTAKWVAALVNAESKYDETVVTGGVCDDTTGSITTLCNPAQGNSVNQRSGDSIKMQNLTIRGSFDQSAATDPNSVCRIIVMIDKDNDITTLAQLLQVTGTANTPFSPKNEDNKFNSKILWDQKFSTNNAAAHREFSKVIKIDQHVHFQAGTATIIDGALKVFCMSNIGVVTAPIVNYIARVTYLDN